MFTLAECTVAVWCNTVLTAAVTLLGWCNRLMIDIDRDRITRCTAAADRRCGGIHIRCTLYAWRCAWRIWRSGIDSDHHITTMDTRCTTNIDLCCRKIVLTICQSTVRCYRESTIHTVGIWCDRCTVYLNGNYRTCRTATVDIRCRIISNSVINRDSDCRCTWCSGIDLNMRCRTCCTWCTAHECLSGNNAMVTL